jgi:hypothetical protein
MRGTSRSTAVCVSSVLLPMFALAACGTGSPAQPDEDAEARWSYRGLRQRFRSWRC